MMYAAKGKKEEILSTAYSVRVNDICRVNANKKYE